MILQSALGEETAGSRDVENLPASQATRMFAILELPAGANPWDCGPLANAREVLGYSLLEWLLPFKYSPCARHDDPESMFKLGPVVEEAKREAGLIDEPESAKVKRKRRRRRGDTVDGDSGGERVARVHRSRRSRSRTDEVR